MTPEEARAEVLERFPAYAFLLSVPEIAEILLAAVDPNAGYSPQEFAARLYNTEWWKKHGATAREWFALQGTDPGTADRQINARVAEIEDIVRPMGLNLSRDALADLAETSLAYGLGASSAEMRNAYANLIGDYAPGSGVIGTFGDAVTEIKRMANQDYLVGIADTDAWNYARRLMSGDLTIEGVEQALRAEAQRRFASVGLDLSSGVTPGQYFAPHRNLIAQELETSAEAIDLLDPRFREVLSHHDGSKVRPMSLNETMLMIRSTPEWASTSRASSMGADMASTLLKTFGEIA